MTESIALAPAPTPGTGRMRTSLPYQAYRFALGNLRMIKRIRLQGGD